MEQVPGTCSIYLVPVILISFHLITFFFWLFNFNLLLLQNKRTNPNRCDDWTP